MYIITLLSIVVYNSSSTCRQGAVETWRTGEGNCPWTWSQLEQW